MLGFFEDDTFARSREAMGMSVQRLDEQVFGITFIISQDPYRFSEIGDTCFRVATTNMRDGSDNIFLIYSVDEEDGNCCLHWVEKV
jgi:hypothetical protein